MLRVGQVTKSLIVLVRPEEVPDVRLKTHLKLDNHNEQGRKLQLLMEENIENIGYINQYDGKMLATIPETEKSNEYIFFTK